jgi:rod shape-determining protein MreC
VLALLIGVMIYAVSMGGYTISTVGIFKSIAAPFQKASNSISSRVEYVLNLYGNAESCYEENQALKAEIATLHTQLADYETTKEELEELQAFVGIKEEHTDFSFSAPCEVIGYVTNDPYYAFMIDSGLEEGLHLYDPVATEQGLVGVITEIGQHTATVTTVLSPDLSVAAYCSTTKDQGVLTGSVSLSREGLCILQYLDRNTQLQKENVILTTGENGLFPKGYVIGYVQDIGMDDTGLTAYASVKPAVELSNLNMVIVITDFDGKERQEDAD